MNKECLKFMEDAGYKNINRSKFPPLVSPEGHNSPEPAYDSDLELWAHPKGGQFRAALETDRRRDWTIDDLVGFMLKSAYSQGAKDEADRRTTSLKRMSTPEPFVIYEKP